MKHTAYVIRRRGYFYVLSFGVRRIVECLRNVESGFHMKEAHVAELIELLENKPFVTLRAIQKDLEKGYMYYAVVKVSGLDLPPEGALWSIQKVEITCDTNLLEHYSVS